MATQRDYRRGFNDAYVLATYSPILLEAVISNLTPSNEYFEGLFDGRDEAKIEYAAIKMKELSALREKSINREKGLEK